GAGGAVLKVDGRHGDDLRLGGRPGDEDVVDEEGVGVGEVVAADVDLELVGVGAVVGDGPGAGDGGPVVGVDGGVADPGERWFGDEPDAWGSGGALGEAGSHGVGVGDAGFEDSGRGLDAFEDVVALDDAQRLAAFGEGDHVEGDVAALGPGAAGAVLKVDGRHGGDLRLGGRPGDEDVVNEEGVGVGEVVAADVDLELVGVGAVVGGGPGAGDGGP